MQTEYLLSGHAQQRLKERLKVKNIRRAHREVEIAYTKGKLINRMQSENKAYFLFNNSVYVFNETFCNVCKLVLLITVYKDIDKKYQSYMKY